MEDPIYQTMACIDEKNKGKKQNKKKRKKFLKLIAR
jgi:hypothetical protein